jgi:hypothetical protein
MTHLWGNVFLSCGIAILPQLEQQALFDLSTHRLNELHGLDKASIEVIKCRAMIRAHSSSLIMLRIFLG